MPNLITQEQYNETIDILKGKAMLNPVYRELKAWYAENTGLEIYNFIIAKNKYGTQGESNKHKLLYLSNGLLLVCNDEFCVGTIHDTDGRRSEKLAEFTKKSFKYFINLCHKYNLFTEIEWQHEVVSGYDFNPIW